MSTHDEMEGLLSAYVDDELTDAERVRLEAQLAESPDLRQKLQQLRQVQQLTGRVSTLPLPRRAKSRLKPRRFRIGMIVGVAAVLLVGVVLAGFLLPSLSRSQDAPRRAQERARAKVSFINGHYRPVTAGTNEQTGGELRGDPAAGYYLGMRYQHGGVRVGITDDSGSMSSMSTLLQDHKVILTGHLNIEVKSWQTTSAAVNRIVTAVGGYIHSSSVIKQKSGARCADVVIRVPPDEFSTTVARLKELGDVKAETTSGRDVTADYIDLEARLKNARAVVDKMKALLDKYSRKLDDILKVEKQLAEAQLKVEKLAGQMKYLSSRTDFGTISVRFYEPKALLSHGTSGGRAIREALSRGLNALVWTAALFLQIGIVLVPWAAAAAAVYLIVRKLRRATA